MQINFPFTVVVSLFSGFDSERFWLHVIEAFDMKSLRIDANDAFLTDRFKNIPICKWTTNQHNLITSSYTNLFSIAMFHLKLVSKVVFYVSKTIAGKWFMRVTRLPNSTDRKLRISQFSYPSDDLE